MDMQTSLQRHIRDHEKSGCREVSRILGAIKMPEGYALMLDGDEMYFYWLRHDGGESCICWNQWWVRKGAVADARGLAAA